MKNLLYIFILLISNSTFAGTVNSFITNKHFNSLSTNESDVAVAVGNNNSLSYFSKHNIIDVYYDNPYLYTPNFTTGIIDGGYFSGHEDFNNFLNVKTEEENRHGTGVFSVSFGSKPGNGLGTLGIVNTYTDLSYINNNNYHYQYINNASNRIISSSYTVESETSYSELTDSFIRKNHIKAFVTLRDVIQGNPNNLYVFSAGNSGVDAIKNNGAIHYTFEEGDETILYDDYYVLSKLDNVLIISAIGYDNILHNYSDYGESIDAATISGVYSACLINDEGNLYNQIENGNYGINKVTLSLTTYQKANCEYNFNGTSASQPITSGMAALLLSMDPSMTGAELKDYLLNSSTESVSERYTGESCDSDYDGLGRCEDGYEIDFLDISIPIIDLNNSYTKLKGDLEGKVADDVIFLHNQEFSETELSNSTCAAFWESEYSPRDAIALENYDDDESSDIPEYYAYRYGNSKCLYYLGNSFIIEYDIETSLAEYLYYGDDNYETYALFRKFYDNMYTANLKSKWRTAYELNESGTTKVTCTNSDECSVITTTYQCENIFEALTGAKLSDMNSFAYLYEENKCMYTDENSGTIFYYLANDGLISFVETIEDATVVGNFYFENEKLSSDEVMQGDTVTVTVDHIYDGYIADDDMGSPKIAYYLSDDNVFSSDDEQLGDDSSSLGYDDKIHYEVESLDIPLDADIGTNYIFFVLDELNNFVETNEDDNLVSLPITVTKLIDDDVSVEEQEIVEYVDDTISVSATLVYSGSTSDSDLDSVEMGYYFSDDDEFSSDDTYLENDFSSVGSDDLSHDEKEDLTLPSGLQPGETYYILFVADHEDELEEIDESNNVEAVSFVYSSPDGDDIYITNASVEHYSGDTYRVYLRQSYSGETSNDDLSNPNVAYIFSKDAIMSSDDIALGTDSSTIGSDDTWDGESFKFDITDYTTSSGTYYIIAYADCYYEIDEVDEENNEIAISFTVD